MKALNLICACGTRAEARGMCHRCYQQWRRTGGTGKFNCIAIERGVRCTGPCYAGRLCNKHHLRMRRYGTAELPTKTKSTKTWQFRLPPFLFEAARSVAETDESMASFVRTALVNEVSRRRTLKRTV